MDSPINIGRGKTNEVKIDSLVLSKKQTSIEYNKSSNIWEIKDGSGSKPSLNGTWLLLNSKYELKHDSYIKLRNNTIKIGVE